MKYGVSKRETCRKEYNKLVDALKLVSKEIHELEIEKATSSESLEGAHTQIRTIDEEIQRLNIINKDVIRETERLQTSIGEQENIIKDLEIGIEKAQATVLDTDSAIGDINRHKEQMDEEITRVRLEMTGLEHEVGFIEARIVQLDDEIGKHEQSLKEKSKAIEDISDNTIICQCEIDEHTDKIGELNT